MTIKVRAAALLFAGLLLVSCGKKEPAKEVTSPAAGRGNAGSLVTEGQALLEKGDAEGAAELFRDAMRKDPKNVEARIGAARVQILRKAYDVASESLDMAAKIEPGTRDSNGRMQFDCSGFTSYVLNAVMQAYIPSYDLSNGIEAQEDGGPETEQ